MAPYISEVNVEYREETRSKASLEKHRFSEDIIKRIRLLNQLDNFHGPLQCLEDWIIILACIAISLLVNQKCSALVAIFVYIVVTCVIGTRMRALAELLHQSAHGTMALNSKLNLILGTVFSGWTVLQSWTGYRRTHVIDHHQFLGNSERDPDFKALIEAGLYGKNIKRSDVIQYLLSIPSPHSTVAYAKYLVINRINPANESNTEKVLRGLFYLLCFIIFLYTRHIGTFILYWIIPTLTTANWVGAFIEFFEHYPLLMKLPHINIFKSRNRICNPIEDFFLGIHNEGYHLVHHIWPRLPAWNLRKAHELMMADSTYRNLHDRKEGWPAILDDVLSNFDD